MYEIVERMDRPSMKMAAGVAAGLIAGALMALTLQVVSLAQGNGFWFPSQLFGGAVFGVSAILGGMAPAITGLLLHFLLSSALGGIFGSMLWRDISAGEVVGGGLLFGVVAWALMTYAVLPWANPTLSDRMALIPGWWFASHLVYGVGLGLARPIVRAFVRSPGAERYPGFEGKAA